MQLTPFEERYTGTISSLTLRYFFMHVCVCPFPLQVVERGISEVPRGVGKGWERALGRP